MKTQHSLLTVVLLCAAFVSVPAQTLLIQNATVMTVAKAGTLENASLLIKDGKILKVGKNIKAPKGAEIFDATGKIITPGLIDCYTHLGLAEIEMDRASNDIDENTRPNTADVRAFDAVNPMAKHIQVTLMGGVTTVLSAPGEGNLLNGQSVVLQLSGKTPEAMFVAEGGIHATLGEAPKRRWGGKRQAPSTRMGEMAMLRQAFFEAQDYLKKWDRYEAKKKKKGAKAKPPSKDLRKDALARVLNKELPLIVSAHRSDDILSALRLQSEFGFRLILNHGSEAHLVAKQLADRDIPVLINPVRQAPSRMETQNAKLENAAILHAAGVTVALGTGETMNIRNLPMEAAFASAYGLGEEETLRAITIVPAQILGVDKRKGSLEKGKDADFVIWDGPPLKVMSHAEQVFILGKKVYEKDW